MRRGALLLCAGLLLSCRQGPVVTADPARGAPAPLLVQRGALEDRVVLTGEAEAVTAENLVVPRTPTWLLSVRWLAEDGAVVKKGDRVVEFDASAFTGSLEDKRTAVVRTESELQSEVARAAAALADAAMEVDRRRSELDKASTEASVPADLYPRRLYQEKQLALSQRRDALAKAEEDLAARRRAAQLERTVKEVARTRAARDLADLEGRLEDLTLRAPRDGMVQIAVNRREGRKYLVGDQTFPGWVVASLPDLSAMQVRAGLSDVDDGALRVGMAAECVLDAYPQKPWRGTVRQLSPVARADGRDASRRFFDVVVALDGKTPALMRPGMSLRVEVIRRRLEGALLVPRAALRAWPGPSEVHLAGGGVQRIEVDFCTELACAARGDLREGTPLLLPAGQGPS